MYNGEWMTRIAINRRSGQQQLFKFDGVKSKYAGWRLVMRNQVCSNDYHYEQLLDVLENHQAPLPNEALAAEHYRGQNMKNMSRMLWSFLTVWVDFSLITAKHMAPEGNGAELCDRSIVLIAPTSCSDCRNMGRVNGP